MTDPKTPRHRAICPTCELEQLIPELVHGERAYCSRCEELLHEYPGHGLDHVISWHFTSLLLLMIALTQPFLALRAGAIEKHGLLLDGTRALWQQDMPFIALVVLLTGSLLPLLYTTCTLYLVIPMSLSRKPPLAATVCHLLEYLKNWSMVEVLALGVLVSLIKLVSMADILFGPGFYALIALIYTFTLSVRSLDMEHIWEWVRPSYEK